DKNEKSLSIKNNSDFWRYFEYMLKSNHDLFIKEGQDYLLQIEKTKDDTLYRGKKFEEIKKEQEIAEPVIQ
ncbi:hypothetical protein, partial [Rodentibacter caecimuris]|uniref:hypothetical protein n=1 Tax=Rodentibacter caecimuris TaxID=1796644 RepID=UPI0015C379AF